MPKFLRLPLLIVITLLIAGATYWYSQPRKQPGPSLAEVKQRGLYAYILASPRPHCVAGLKTSYKECRVLKGKRNTIDMLIRYDDAGGLIRYLYGSYATMNRELIQFENGFEVFLHRSSIETFLAGTDTIADAFNECMEQPATDTSLFYQCTYYRNYIPRKVHSTSTLHYEQTTGTFTEKSTLEDATKHDTFTYDAQGRLTHLTQKQTGTYKGTGYSSTNHIKFEYIEQPNGDTTVINHVTMEKSSGTWWQQQGAAVSEWLNDEKPEYGSISHTRKISYTLSKPDAKGNPTQVRFDKSGITQTLEYQY